MQKDFERYKIHYDVWFRETTLHESGAVEETVKMLTDAGATYEQDGALWLQVRPRSAQKRTMFCAARTVSTPILQRISHTTATSSKPAALTGD